MKWRRYLSYAVSFTIVVGLVTWLTKNQGITLNEVHKAVSRFSPTFLACALFLILLLQLPMQSTRLWLLLPTPRKLSWWSTFRAFIFGQAINAFAPARAGDAIKVVILNKESQDRVSFAMGAGVLLSDKLIDLVSFLILALAAGQALWQQFKHIPLPPLKQSGLVVALLLVGIVTLSFLVPQLYARLRALIRSVYSGISAGLAPLTNPTQCLLGLAASLLSWTAETLAVQTLSWGQGYQVTFPEVISVMVILNIGVAVPISVANIGVFEASMALALRQLGIPSLEAFTIATAHHCFQIIGVYFWGVYLTLLRSFTRKSSLKTFPNI